MRRRQDHHRREREPPVEDRQGDHRAGQREHVADERREPLREHVGERVHVVRDARDDPARALLREVAQRERREVPEEMLAQPQHDQLAELREAEDQERADEPGGGVDADVDRDVEVEARPVSWARMPLSIASPTSSQPPTCTAEVNAAASASSAMRAALIAHVERQAGQPDAALTRHGPRPRTGARTCRRPSAGCRGGASSTITPSSSTTARSASETVERRWLESSTVRPASAGRRRRTMCSSVSVSTAESGSSSTSTRALEISARASATRWR